MIVAIAYNTQKQGLFTVEERRELIRQSVRGNGNVIIDSFDGLLVDYVKKMDARFVIRGLGPSPILSTSSRWPRWIEP